MRARYLFVGSLGVVCLLALPGVRPALALGEQTIAVVVDLGSGQTPTIVCVKEPAGVTDAQALKDAMALEGFASPSYAASGLLCSIGGVPTSGCGVRSSSGYAYWAYFHGDAAGWHYASDGPAERTASASVAEGWRFESAGTGNPTDPAPQASSSPSTLCPAASTTTTLPAQASAAAPEQDSSTPSAQTGGVPSTTQPLAVPSSVPAANAAAPATDSKKGVHFVAASANTGAPPTLAIAALAGFASMAIAAAIISQRRRARGHGIHDDDQAA